MAAQGHRGLVTFITRHQGLRTIGERVAHHDSRATFQARAKSPSLNHFHTPTHRYTMRSYSLNSSATHSVSVILSPKPYRRITARSLS